MITDILIYIEVKKNISRYENFTKVQMMSQNFKKIQ